MLRLGNSGLILSWSAEAAVLGGSEKETHEYSEQSLSR